MVCLVLDGRLSAQLPVVSRWFERTQRQSHRLCRRRDRLRDGALHPWQCLADRDLWLAPGLAILGTVIVALLVPLNLWQRCPPVASGHTVSTASFGHALRHRAFWMLCLAHCCMTITMTMVNVHLVPFLVSSGRLELVAPPRYRAP